MLFVTFKNRTNVIIAVLASTITGYGLGYWASGLFEPQCASETLREKLISSNHEFWKEAGAIALVLRNVSVHKCIALVNHVIDATEPVMTETAKSEHAPPYALKEYATGAFSPPEAIELKAKFGQKANKFGQTWT